VVVVVFTEVRKSQIVAAVEAVTVIVAEGWRNVGMAEFVSSFHIRGTMILDVLVGALNAIVEALALKVTELRWRRIPAAANLDDGCRNWSRSCLEVRNGQIVAAAEAVAVIIAEGWRNVGIAEFISSFHIRGTMILDVLVGALNAIVEALALKVAKLRWRRIPAAAILAIAWLRVVLGLAVLRPEQGRGSQGENKRGKCEMMKLHG
jgi:hypothetical protein